MLPTSFSALSITLPEPSNSVLVDLSNCQSLRLPEDTSPGRKREKENHVSVFLGTVMQRKKKSSVLF